MRSPYSDSEVKKALEMRAKGTPWKQIAEALGRNEKAVYSKFAKLRRSKAASPTKRTYTQKAAITISPTGVTQYRPMIALVGSPSEVTTTIRELFS